jgi:hypothetical protein
VPAGCAYRVSVLHGDEELASASGSFGEDQWERTEYLSVPALDQELSMQALGYAGAPSESESSPSEREESEVSPAVGASLRLLLGWTSESSPGDEIPRVESRLFLLDTSNPTNPLPQRWTRLPIDPVVNAIVGEGLAGAFTSALLRPGRYVRELRVDDKLLEAQEVILTAGGQRDVLMRIPARELNEETTER